MSTAPNARHGDSYHHSSESNEWHTPAEWITAARLVMGSIELDPASCEQANRIVQASRFYTAQDNGLMQPWQAATLWCNPPYGGLHKRFIPHLIESYEAGNVKQAILLINAEVGANWFQPLWRYWVCLKHGRISFIDEHGTVQDGPGHYNAFVYFGPDTARFREIFQAFGRIVPPDDQPTQLHHSLVSGGAA